jgi:hypothetical protein
MWLFPEVEIGDITMQDTINTATTQTTAKENTSKLVPLAVPFELRPLSNSGTFKSTTTTGISENHDSIPRPSLNLVTTLAPSLMIDDSLLAPPLINLEMSGLRQFPRIAALKNANSDGPAIAADSVSTIELPSRHMSSKPRL